MRPVLLSLATAALFATVGSAWADPDPDERGRGHGRGGGDRREQPREAGRRAREDGEGLREIRVAQVYGDTYRNSGYRGYTPAVPYPNATPQPGGYPGYPNRGVNSYGNYGNGQGASLTDQLL